MSITAVPISIERVRAATAASSGNGELSWRAKWWTRKYAPSAPNSSAATASSIDWSSESAAERTRDPYESLQCPNERKPIFFNAYHRRPFYVSALSSIWYGQRARRRCRVETSDRVTLCYGTDDPLR